MTSSETHTNRPVGRPPQISRQEIVDVACELGLDAFTMTSVADRLGVSTPALYTHVKNRDELLSLVSEQLVRRIAERLDDGGDWRSYLISLARAVREALTWSRWAVMDQVEGPSAGGVAIGERGLQILTEAGFSPVEAGRAIWLVLRVALTAGTADEPSIDAQLRSAPELNDPPDDLPLTRAAIAALHGRAEGANVIDPFDADLEIVLDGLELRLSTGR